MTVGVNSDRFVLEYKGRAPASSERHRQRVVDAIYCVSTAAINDGPGADLIRAVKPDILVIGSDWHKNDYLEQIDIKQEELDELYVSVLYLPRTPGVSTSELRS